MRRQFLILAPIILCLALSKIAVADTDFHCLNLCVQSGKPSATCMPECTYTSQSSSGTANTKDPSQFLENHRVLTPLQPVANDQVLITPPTKVSPYHQSHDYKCLSQCLHNKMQYQTCSQSCTVITTADGTVVTSPTQKSYRSEAVTRFERQQASQTQSQSLSNGTIP